MLFNSAGFLVFILIVYPLYVCLRHRHTAQNRVLLAASCVFYGAWDWRFLSLLFLTIGIDYYIGLKLYAEQDSGRRKLLVGISIAANLAILGFFKYFDFFTESLISLLHWAGIGAHMPTIRVILPIGISFYTFQSMSYAVDIYRKQLKPAKNILDFALFVTYFPQLVAGPIERASHLLPQVLEKRAMKPEQIFQGCYLIFWGLFQKVFVADNLAKIVDPIFTGKAPYDGLQVIISLYAFAFQIYCDFAGYSNIAIGLGKCMGFDIMTNFNLPYFSTNPREFWSRWHISLSTWLRDYLYIPLGGNRKGALLTCRNLAITMVMGGLWHGAKWTFVLWGAYQGFLLITHKMIRHITGKMRPAGGLWPDLPGPLKGFIFFNLVCIGWLLFRADSFSQAAQMLAGLFRTDSLFTVTPQTRAMIIQFVFYTAALVAVESYLYLKKDLMAVYRSDFPVKTAVIVGLLCLYLMFGEFGVRPFIYFQF